MEARTMEYDKEKAKANGCRSTLDVLEMLKVERPELWQRAEVVGRWVWIKFDAKPSAETRRWLLEAGFRWNHRRQYWQHACGVWRRHSAGDPRMVYGSVQADELEPATA